MSTGPIATAAAELAAALAAVEEVAVYTNIAAKIDPPGVVIGPPALEWQTHCLSPSSATFAVFVVVRADDYALDRLWELVPQVAAALDALPEAAVTRATPTVYNGAGVDLPAYMITVEVAL